MYSKVLAVSVVIMVVVGVTAGCGGGGQQDAQSQGSEQGEQREERSSNKGKKAESLDGTMARVLPERDAVVVRPEDGRSVPFRYRPENVKVTLDGEQAEPEEIEKGQTASIRYVTRTTEKDREVNMARSIELESRNGSEATG